MLAKFEKFNLLLSNSFLWIGAAGICAMILVAAGDVIGLKFFGEPIHGSVDIIVVAQIIAISFAASLSLILNRHLAVEMVFEKLHGRTRTVIEAVVTFLTLVLFIVLVWRMWGYADNLRMRGTSSYVLYLPLYPYAYAMAVAFIPVCLTLLQKFLTLVTTMRGTEK